MDCLKCELTRAKLKTACLLIVGWSLTQIAEHLSNCYGERYYVENDKLYRASKLSPYTPHLIRNNANDS